MKLLIVLLLFSSNVFAEISTQIAFPNLDFNRPVDLQYIPNGSNQFFVVQQSGEIFSFLNSSEVEEKTLFIDLSEQVSFGGEQGLLGLAFHPDFPENGYFYVNYTRASDGASVISRFTTEEGVGLLSSELILLVIRQPFSNHNGGALAFGPDGFLYIATGDGGSAGDPRNHAQNLKSLLGKILRIDVNRTQGRKPYAIPRNNPFVKDARKLKKEIYAYGLRNPWRMSFDQNTGKLWLGDVGQNSTEEIDIIRRGGNYGWRLFEGDQQYNCPPEICFSTKTIKPVHTYSHDLGSSVTGGYVYRGQELLSLQGKYIFADFISGRIFSLSKNGRQYVSEELLNTDLTISAFGVDFEQNLYFLDYQGGQIWKMLESE